jgi:cyclopropane fatty-acyl-phospholipid synthase-like methyltransferase
MSKRFSPACERNKKFILEVLQQHLPKKAKLLEIASGTGQHANYFAEQESGWVIQTTDTDPLALSSIQSYQKESKRENFLAPLKLSVTEEPWSLETFDAALCCNMSHIAPWEACEGLFKGMSQYLKSDACLILYGPFLQKGVETTESNLRFDESLRQRDSRSGLRSLEKVQELADSFGFGLKQVHQMPANNLSVVFYK